MSAVARTWCAMTCRRKRRCCGCKDAFRQYPGSAPWQTQTPGRFLHVIARSEATWQSVLPAAAQSKEQRLRRIRESAYGFARSSASLPSFSAGMRIATPVCALARNDMQKEGRVRGCKNVACNDMQKTEACQRLQGRGDMQKTGRCARVQGRGAQCHAENGYPEPPIPQFTGIVPCLPGKVNLWARVAKIHGAAPG